MLYFLIYSFFSFILFVFSFHNISPCLSFILFFCFPTPSAPFSHCLCPFAAPSLQSFQYFTFFLSFVLISRCHAVLSCPTSLSDLFHLTRPFVLPLELFSASSFLPRISHINASKLRFTVCLVSGSLSSFHQYFVPYHTLKLPFSLS